MKGATATITMILLLLIVVASSGMFFSYYNNLKANIVAAGEGQMVELDIPPKLLALVCYNGYGYMDLSLSQGQEKVSGTVLYTVDLDTGKRVSEGFTEMELTDAGKVFIPYLFNTSERYFVSLAGKRWKISEYCRPFNDPHMKVYLPLDESSGTTASDASDYELDGAVTGGTWSRGYLGNAILLSGDTQYIDVPNSEDIQNYTSFTVSLWFKYAGRGPLAKAYHTLVNKNPTGMGYNDPFHLWILNSTQVVQARIGNGTGEYQLSGASSINDGNYHFVSFTYNGTSKDYELRIDGEYEANKTITSSWIPAQNSADLTIGRWAPYSNYFNGTIDEFRFYTRALSGDELTALYDGYLEGP
ncbi:MAG: LamG domain-containing protein [Candidatus Altiarchaeota archaeon]|nr:LamG domain-containing protein [Candidatus Altiarchaeota archaeon]